MTMDVRYRGLQRRPLAWSSQSAASESFSQNVSSWPTDSLNSTAKTTTHVMEPAPEMPDEILQELCLVLGQSRGDLSSQSLTVKNDEVCRVRTVADRFRHRLHRPGRTRWSVETGEGSSSSSVASSAASRLVFHVFSAPTEGKVLGKLDVQRPGRRLVTSRLSTAGARAADLLSDLSVATPAELRDRYRPAPGHFTLAEVKDERLRVSFFGAVTSLCKVPTKGRNWWHQFLCLSDPSLVAGEPGHEAPPAEFKMHVFLPQRGDFPELHRGDVVRFTDVKVECHHNRVDGRIFSKENLHVYCCPDQRTPPAGERIRAHSDSVRLLSRWWRVNERYFDYATPHPLYQLDYKYPGVRMLREVTDQLVFDLYCQVAALSAGDDGGNDAVRWLCVRDGTVFTTVDPKRPARPETHDAARPTYGFQALVVLSSDQWRQVRSSALAVGDHLLLHEVCAALVPDRVLAASGVPFRHPCVLLSINSDASAGAGAGCCFQKIPPGHHESQKIRTRLHRLPDVLEEMKNWKMPETTTPGPNSGDLNDPDVQLRILKRLRPF